MNEKFSISMKAAQELVDDMMETNEITDKMELAQGLLKDIINELKDPEGDATEISDNAMTLACIAILLHAEYEEE